MKIPKPSEEDKDYFGSIVPDDPRVEVKPMWALDHTGAMPPKKKKRRQ